MEKEVFRGYSICRTNIFTTVSRNRIRDLSRLNTRLIIKAMASSHHNTRIAWLLPTAWFYWQPSLSELAQKFSPTKVFTGLWPGFAQGYEDKLDVQVIGDRKVINIASDTKSYGNNFTYLSPSIIFPLLKLKPDVIFSSSFGVWTLLALLLKPIGRWRVIIAYEGSSPSVDFKNSKKRLTLRRTMVKAATACITNSHQGKDYLTKTLQAPSAKVFAHPYEVPDPKSLLASTDDTAQLPPLQLSNKNLRHPTFIFVGSLIPRKGMQCLLQACQILKNKGIEEYTLLVVGEGSQAQELKSFCQEQDLNEQVCWLGKVPYEQLGQYFQHSDVFVLPTLEDTWGMVILEAMILGKPILCSTGAGASELVQQGQNGFCFEPEDADKLAGLMEHFITHPDAIATMGQNSQQIMAQYTPEKAGDFLAEVTHFVLRQP